MPAVRAGVDGCDGADGDRRRGALFRPRQRLPRRGHDGQRPSDARSRDGRLSLCRCRLRLKPVRTVDRPRPPLHRAGCRDLRRLARRAVDCAPSASSLAPERAMLGPPKPRRLDEPIAVSLEDLVPPDHFYRHLEAKLDLGFVREWVRELLRRAGPAEHRPGRLLQAAAGHVLRGHPLRAPADRDGQPQPGPPLVPRLRPR